MTLINRFKKLNIWNKIATIGSACSITAFLFLFYPEEKNRGDISINVNPNIIVNSKLNTSDLSKKDIGKNLQSKEKEVNKANNQVVVSSTSWERDTGSFPILNVILTNTYEVPSVISAYYANIIYYSVKPSMPKTRELQVLSVIDVSLPFEKGMIKKDLPSPIHLAPKDSVYLKFRFDVQKDSPASYRFEFGLIDGVFSHLPIGEFNL